MQLVRESPASSRRVGCANLMNIYHWDPWIMARERGSGHRRRDSAALCVSHWSFRFSSALERRSAITVVFLAFSIEAGLVLHSSLMVFHGQVSSGSAGYLPFVRLTGRTSATPTTRSYALSTSSLQKNVRFHARA